MMNMYSHLFAAAFVVLAAAAPVAAQTTNPCPAETTGNRHLGSVPAFQPFALNWDFPSSTPAGVKFSLYRDTGVHKNWVDTDITITPHPTAAGCFVYRAVVPPLPVGGPHNIKIRAYFGTDPSTATDRVDSAVFTINVIAVPTGIRIVLTPTTSGNNDALGVQLEVTTSDGVTFKEFVPVAHRRTGAFLSSMFLATPTILLR